jgi:AraC-type transcriptional regulator N-terminus
MAILSTAAFAFCSDIVSSSFPDSGYVASTVNGNAEGSHFYAYSCHVDYSCMPPRNGKPIDRLGELALALRSYTDTHKGGNPFVTAIEGFTILRSKHEKQPSHRIFKPALCVAVQGAKWATFGEKRYDYRAGQALCRKRRNAFARYRFSRQPDRAVLGTCD